MEEKYITSFFNNFLGTLKGLSYNFLMTFSGLFKEFLRTFSGLCKDFLRTFYAHSEFGTDCLGLGSYDGPNVSQAMVITPPIQDVTDILIDKNKHVCKTLQQQ